MKWDPWIVVARLLTGVIALVVSASVLVATNDCKEARAQRPSSFTPHARSTR